MANYLSDVLKERIARGITQSYRWAIAGVVAFSMNVLPSAKTPTDYGVAMLFVLAVIFFGGLVDAWAFQKWDPDLPT